MFAVEWSCMLLIHHKGVSLTRPVFNHFIRDLSPILHAGLGSGFVLSVIEDLVLVGRKLRRAMTNMT